MATNLRATGIWVGLAIVAGAALGAWWYASHSQPSALAPTQAGMSCDMGISAAKAARGATSSTAQPVAGNTQTAQPASDSPGKKVPPPPGPAPEGMVWIPGGEFWMGADEFPDAQPWHRVFVDGFWMDKTEVTNEQFETFVKATKYVTVAERTPRASGPMTASLTLAASTRRSRIAGALSVVSKRRGEKRIFRRRSTSRLDRHVPKVTSKRM